MGDSCFSLCSLNTDANIYPLDGRMLANHRCLTLEGIEPTTFELEVQHSVPLNYRAN